jgi:hypothetical protein
MKGSGLVEGLTRTDLKRAMEALFAEGTLVANAELWRGADRKPVLGLARRAPAVELTSGGREPAGEGFNP